MPIRFPDYDAVKALGSYAIIYSQGFAIDETANEAWIVCEANGGSDSKNWITVWDRTTGAHRRTFSAGDGICEGIVLLYEGGSRFLYVKSSGTGMGKYNVTALPVALTTISPASTYPIGMRSRFGYSNGEWLVMLAGSPVSTYGRYYIAGRFDSSFNMKGTIDFGLMEVGYGNLTDGAYAAYLPKHQTITPCRGFIAAGVGGSFQSANPVEPYRYRGITICNNVGQKIA